MRSRPIQTKNQNARYLFLLVLLIIFIATVGVKLVINTSIWLSDLSRGTTSEDARLKKTDILGPAQLYDVPDATNSATLKLSGQGTRGTDITIFVNDEVADKQTLDSDEFETTLSLSQGDNAIYIESKDPQSKKTKDSQTYTVTLISAKPSLTITTPTDGQFVDSDSITVEGSTDPDVSIQINNSPAVVGADGSFSHALSLSTGENVIVIVATDRAGNTERAEIRVKREN